MPEGGNQIVEFTPSQLQKMPFREALNHWAPNLAGGLPNHIPVERFKRVLITAVSVNPELAEADRRSLFNACARCAHDGLYPDGREAALVVYNTEIRKRVRDKDTGQFLKDEDGRFVEGRFWAQMVQYMPMIAGIRKRMRNTGQVLSADAEVVYSKDEFKHSKGDDAKIIHNPPQLGEDRGSPIGAYAIIKLTNGEVLREVMSAAEINHIRKSFSKAPDSPAWKKTPDEMWRKTVMRRCAKAAPSGSDLDVLLSRDEEIDRPDEHSPMREIPQRPNPQDYMVITDDRDDGALPPGDEGTTDQVGTGEVFEVFNCVGERTEFATAEAALEALAGLIAAERSLRSLEGLSESNPTLAQYPSIIAAYKDQKEALNNTGNRQDRPATGAQQTDPARGATDTASPGRTEHPEGDTQSTLGERIVTQELQAAMVTTPAAAGTPNSQTERPRDEPKQSPRPTTEPFMGTGNYKLPDTTKPKDLLYYLGTQYLPKCRDQFDINGIEADNERLLAYLSPNDQREAADMIALRRKEIG